MLQEITLKANKRDTGKKAAKAVRNNNCVPGVFYSKGSDSLNISADSRDLRHIVYTSRIKLVNLEIDGVTKKCMLKDVKFDPVTDKIVHFDLLGISDDRKLTVELPFEFMGGQPIGVRKGGHFQQVFHKCKISCLPEHLLSSLEINVADLDVGQSIHLKDLDFPGINYEIPADSLICAVNIPRGKLGEALRGDNS